jgi:transposase-like protein
MGKRRYSDQDRAAAVAAVTANGGNIQRTARQLGIPETSLRQWVKAERHPEAAQMSVEKEARWPTRWSGWSGSWSRGSTTRTR